MKRSFYLSLFLSISFFLSSGAVFAQATGCTKFEPGLISEEVCVGGLAAIPLVIEPAGCIPTDGMVLELAGPLPFPTASCNFSTIALSTTGNTLQIPLNFQKGRYCVRFRRGDLVSAVKSFNIDTIDFAPAPQVEIEQLPPIRPSYCKGDTVRFRIKSVTNGGSNYSLQWSRNDTARVGDTASIFTVTNLTDGDYVSASITRQNKCALNATGRSDSLSITVNKPPIVNVELRPGSTGCEQTINSFIAKLQLAGPDPNVIWTRSSGSRIDTLSQGINDTLFTLSPADSAKFGDTISAQVVTGRCNLQDKDFFIIRACGEVVIDPPLDTTDCAGTIFPVPYQLIGSFVPGNVFTVQLSDGNGSFSTPLQIGTLSAFRPDTIPALLPVEIPAGNCYRVRILSSAPADTSDTSACFKVFPRPLKPLTLNDSVCGSGEVTLSASSSEADVTFNWYSNPFSGSVLFSGPSRTFNIQGDSVYFVSAVSSRGCESERTEVRAISNQATPVEAGADQSFCQGTQTFQLTPSIAGGDWTGPIAVINNQVDLTGIQVGTYNLVYTTINSLGCRATDSLKITVKAIPDANGGPDVQSCSNASVIQLTGTPEGGTWIGSSILSDGSYNPALSAAEVDTVRYSYTENGCTGIDTVVIFVRPAPGAFVVNAVNPSSCAVDDGTASIVGIDSLLPGWTIRWSVNRADSSSAFPTLSLLGGGSYSVQIRDTASACFRTQFFSLSDPEVPPPVISGVFPAYCNNDSCQLLSVSPTSPNGFWSGTGVTTLQVGEASFCPAVAGQGETAINYQYDDASGCIGATTVTVQINPAPVVNAGVLTDTLCSDAAPLQLTDFSPSSPPAIWGPQPLVSLTGLFNPSLASPGANELTLTLTTNGCTGTSSRTVMVEPRPEPLITRNPVNPVCAGGEVVLSVNPGAGVNTRRVEWFFNNQIIPNQNGLQISVTQQGTYRAVVTGIGQCSSSSPEFDVLFNQLPPDSVTINGTANPCSNNLSSLQAPTGTGLTYQWFSGNDSIAGAEAAGFQPVSSGLYRVRIRNSSGCESLSDFIAIDVRQAPTVSAIVPGSDTCLQPGQPISIELSAGGQGLSFQWFRQGTPDVQLDGETSSTISGINLAGRYFAVITSSNGCELNSDTISVNETTTITIQDSIILKCQGDDPFLVTAGISPDGCPLLFNGQPLLNNLWNPDQPGDFILTYQCTNDNGCTSRKNVVIRVTPPPPSNLIALGPINRCAGDSVLLQVNDGSESGFSYQLYRNGQPFGSPFVFPFVRVSQTGSYQVEVRFGRCNVLSNTLNVNFRPAPQAQAGNDVSECGFFNAELNSGSGITPGEWSGSPRVVTSGQYQSNGFIGCDTLQLTVTENGCSGTDTKIICIKPQPDVQAVAQDASNCDVTDGSAWVVDGSVLDTYSWTKLNSTTVLSTTDSLKNVAAGVYQVTITNTTSACSIVRNVVINTPNNLDVDFAGLPDSVCFGSEPVQLTGILAGSPSDSGSFSSFANRITEGNVYDPTIPGPLVDTVYYTASLGGCVGTRSRIIKLNPLPVLDAGPDSRVCFGDTLILRAVQPAGVPLVWIGPQITGDSLFIANNASLSSALVTVSYSRNGCSSTDTRLISLDTLPQFNVLPSSVSSCGSCDGGAIREISNSTQYQTIWREITANTIIGTGPSLSNRCVGVYSVQVIRNTTGCSRTETFGITGPTNLDPFACLQNVPDGICQDGPLVAIGKCDNSARIFIGGVETDTLNPAALPPGNAQILLTLTDSNGCTGVEQKTVPVRPQPIINLAGINQDFACTSQGSFQLAGFFPSFDPAVPENGWSATGAPAGFITRAGLINPGLVSNDAVITLKYQVKNPGPDGCIGSKSIPFRIYKNPFATITPSTGIVTICQGSEALLVAGPSNPGFTYKWKLGVTNPQPIGFNDSLLATLPGQYSLEVSNNGCVSQNPSVIQVVVNPAPIIASIGPDTTVCQNGLTINLPAPNVVGTTSFSAWQAITEVPDGFLTSSGTVNPNIVVPGVYLIRYVAVQENCGDTAIRKITVNPNIISTIAGPQSIELCSGQSTVLSADTSGNGISYRWYRNGVEIPNSDTVNLVADSSGEYRVKILLNGSGVCSNLSADFVNLVVKPSPVVVLGGDPVLSICFPGTLIPLQGGGQFNYNPDGEGKWYSPVSGLVDPNTGNLNPASIPAQGNYELLLTEAIGTCTDTAKLLVKAFKTPDASFSSDASAICDGDRIKLTYSNPDNNNTIWYRNNSIVLSGVDSLLVTTAGSYKLRVENVGNPQCFDEESASYEVRPKPVFNLPSDTIICRNAAPVQLFPISPSPGTGIWSGPGITSNGLWNPKSAEVPESGEITLNYLLVAEGCSTAKSFRIDVGAIPEVVISISDDTAEILQPVTISASGGVAFNWTPAEGLSSASGPVVVARIPETKTYTVMVTSSKGCKAEKSVEIIVDQEFQVYDAFSPNKDEKNDFWLVKNIRKYPEARVKIFNRWGNLVFESDPGYTKPWDGTFEGNPVPPGAYYYIIELGQGLTPKSGSVTLVR